MTIVNIAPYFLLTALFLCAAYLAVGVSGFYQARAQHSFTVAYPTLDGLRGFLAFGVFFHHSVISYLYYQTGQWQLPPSRFYTDLGQAAVALFFMITGFLFCSKLITAKGRLDVRKLYLGRVKRLLPMYGFAVAMVTLAAMVLTHFRFTNSHTLLAEITTWLLYPLSKLTGLTILPPVNGYLKTPLIDTVFWTLTYEVVFYLILPALTLFVLKRRHYWAALFGIAAFCIIQKDFFVFNFVLGALAARIHQDFRLEKWLQSPYASVIPLAALTYVLAHYYGIYALPSELLLLLFFIFIVYGNSLFGLLKLRAAAILGVISYSVYLLHNIVLYCGLFLVNEWFSIASISPMAYWGIVGILGIITLTIALVTYRLIEHPFLSH